VTGELRTRECTQHFLGTAALVKCGFALIELLELWLADEPI
jgi:hypothetical protein